MDNIVLSNVDCLEYIKTIPDKSVDLILTDPPYNIAQYSTGNIPLPGRSAVNNDLGEWDLKEINPFDFVDDFKRILKPDGNIFIFTSYNLIGKWHEVFDPEFDTFQYFIWHKTNPMPKIFRNGFLTELNITKIQEYEKQILMRMKSISKDCRCPKCGYITDKYHGTYIRKVQDLPILGKMVQLEICSHEYECINNDCEVTTFAETFDGFLNTYSRMTERCADFICTLAMESGCEGCARICKALGIKISGDTVIRLLLRKYEVLSGSA